MKTKTLVMHALVAGIYTAVSFLELMPLVLFKSG